MTTWDALLLGLVQGATEFLPVSSSGHLAVVGHLLGLGQGDVATTFFIWLHFFTLLAIVVYFWRDLLNISRNEVVVIGLATLPAVLVGLLLGDYIKLLFSSLLAVGLALVVTGLVNIAAGRMMSRRKKNRQKIEMKDGLAIGLLQSLALLPGISRSGMTVATGIFREIDRQTAFRFSFMLAIPAILGASFYELITLGDLATVEWLPFLVGGIVAFGAGYLSLLLFAKVLDKSKIEWFGFYTIALGLLLLLTQM